MKNKIIYCPLNKEWVLRKDCEPCEMCDDNQTTTEEEINKELNENQI